MAGTTTQLTATELAVGYSSGDYSPVEVTRTSLDRIAARQDDLNAFCLVDPETSLAQARDSETRWRQGHPIGPLDGVPVSIKDLLLTAGWPTLRGSKAIDPHRDWDIDAPVTARLREHGCVLIGKTTTPEFGWKGVTDSSLTGVTRNPWNPTLTAGGSSGGGAAAVAAGLNPLAVGTDGGGSIRIPCAFCGLPGLKPTFGRVPAWPPSPFGLLSHAGPMARTVADLTALLDVISEPDPRDWMALSSPPRRFSATLDDGVAGLRIAFSADLGYAKVHPEIASAVSRAAERFRELGATVSAVAPPISDPRSSFDVLWSSGAAKALADLGDPPREILDEGLADIAESARPRSALEYLEASRQRDELAVRMSVFHTEWDLLLTPAVPIAAFAAGREVPEDSLDPRWPSWTPFTYPFNLTQQPAATVPCGLTSDGLPIGLQIVGPRYRDDLVLRAAAAYEAIDPALCPPAYRD